MSVPENESAALNAHCDEHDRTREICDRLGSTHVIPNPPQAATDACARCGLPALGYATIGDQRVCHSDEERPSCYELALWDRAVAREASEPVTARDLLGILPNHPGGGRG